jgi:pyruvate/2-oxoglutarate/acetoin dehydrogenase E1 component
MGPEAESEQHGLFVEVVDLHTLLPYDEGAVFFSVRVGS